MTFRSIYKKPIIIAGNGVRSAGAVDLLRKLYKKTMIPIVTTMNAVDVMQGDDKIGFIGVYGNRVANMIVAESDLVISVGARLGLRQIGNKKEYFAPKAHLIRVDIDQNELSRDIKDREEKHLADAKEYLQSLLSEDLQKYECWNKTCFELKDLLDPFDNDLGNLCVKEVSKLLPENPIVAVDIGQTQCWCAQSLDLKGENARILIGGSYGSMGCALPYAIGAYIARDYSTIVCITGDGGLQMNIQELQTVVSEKLPIKIIVINNRALGKITEIQKGACEERYCITTEGSGYSVPDFEKVAKAYGIKAKTYYSIEDISDCSSWIEDNDPCLLNIVLPEALELQPKMNWNEREMKPLLSDDVIKKAKKIISN